MFRTQTLSNHLSGPPLSASYSSTSSKDGKSTQTKAVIFDMGGVIVPSPGALFDAYETRLGVPQGTLIGVITRDDGPWGKLEKGEISWDHFSEKFTEDISKIVGHPLDLAPMLQYLQNKKSVPIFDKMVHAIKCIQAEGINTALLTNIWYDREGKDTFLPINTDMFDVIVESCRIGIRKPDPRAYSITLEKLNVAPEDAIYLDDLPANLKVPKEMGVQTILVSDTDKAIAELSKMLDLDLRYYAPGTSSVPKRLELPMNNLKAYLNSMLGVEAKGEPVLRCYEHGQSNPTYFIRYADQNMVLRKKPPGKLLPSAHAVEREYRAMKALKPMGIPVPKMLSLCEDSSVLGTPFYIMEYVEGRIFKDPTLPDMSTDERRQIYSSMCETMAKIHSVDIDKAGLGDFGKRGGYMMRNFNRWTKQFEASKTGEIPSMDQLKEWLLERMPQQEKCTVIHGDYRLDNLIIHPTRPEVIAVLDWELCTLGDPISDLVSNCIGYFLPEGLQSLQGFRKPMGSDETTALGIPTLADYTDQYHTYTGTPHADNLEFYASFSCYKMCCILQGVYKRFTIGQAASPSAESAGLMTSVYADVAWELATKSNIPPNPKFVTTSGSPMTSGSLPLSISDLSPRGQDFYKRTKKFIDEEISPRQKDFSDFASNPKNKWKINPLVEELKIKARAQGLWNLFLSADCDPEGKYGPQLTNVEYGYICEEMGKSPISSEIFNCSAPDSGNIEVLVRYGTEEQKEKWLKPLLEGETRSCFGMTEPAVASSDATNIRASIRRDGDQYVTNGHKWWTSGAMDPRCTMCVFMGRTDSSAAAHRQQSMIIVPMDAPGITIVRPLTVMGYDDSPHGHAEVLFENVCVPASNMLYGEGRGFEIAQGRLGPARIHHCMRNIGVAERGLALMVDRVQNRVAFGKPLAAQGSIQQDIAKSRIEIERSRLLVLKTAHMMDTVGNKVAAPELSMIKVDVLNMTLRVLDRAIQAFGGMGVSQDTFLASAFALTRSLIIADGPDAVHLRNVFRAELRQQRKTKL